MMPLGSCNNLNSLWLNWYPTLSHASSKSPAIILFQIKNGKFIKKNINLLLCWVDIRAICRSDTKTIKKWWTIYHFNSIWNDKLLFYIVFVVKVTCECVGKIRTSYCNPPKGHVFRVLIWVQVFCNLNSLLVEIYHNIGW